MPSTFRRIVRKYWNSRDTARDPQLPIGSVIYGTNISRSHGRIEGGGLGDKLEGKTMFSVGASNSIKRAV